MKTTKKLLSVLLAVMMIVTSISVCFTSLAAGGSATEAQWTDLVNALKKETIAGATFSGTTNNYTVNDPDGSVLAAVEAYWAVFKALANTSPAANTGGNEGNRTINQVNDSIKSSLSSRMGADYTTYNVANFITNLIAGANVTSGFGTRIDRTNTTKPGTNLGTVNAVNLTVQSDNTLLSYDSVDALPDTLTLSKTFTVNHTNANYNYSTEDITTGEGCDAETTTHRYYDFYYNISGTSEKANTEDVSYIKEIKPQIEVYADYFGYSLDYLVDNVDTATLSSVRNAVNTIYGKLIPETWNHFYSEYKAAELIADLDLAAEIISVMLATDNNTALEAAGYEGYDKAALDALYAELNPGVLTYEGASAGAKEFITGRGYDHEAIVAFAAAVLREIELIELRALKADIDAKAPIYKAYNEDDVAVGTTTSGELNIAKGDVDGWIAALATYVPANIAEVWEGFDIGSDLRALSNELAGLITLGGYTDEFAREYANYIADIFAKTNLADDSADLLQALKDTDAWFTGIKNLFSRYESALGADLAGKIFKERDAEMKAHMDSRFEALYARVEAEIDLATELYTLIKAYTGITVVNINTYSKYKRALGIIEKDAYDFLIASANFAMPQSTIDKYNALDKMDNKENGLLKQYNDFIATGGFNSFAQQYLEYKERAPYENDLVRDEAYKVTEEKLLNVIEGIDTLIGSGVVKNLLGGLLNEDGAPLDIAALIKGLLKDALFTDSFINTVVKMLYPLVLTEFIKVWANDLPTEAMGATVTYDKDLRTILGEAGFELFPGNLAQVLDKNKYEANIKLLNDALASFQSAYKAGSNHYITEYNESEGKNVAKKTPWDAPNLYKVDDEGNVTDQLAFTWGVDAAKEKVANGEMTDAQFEAFFYNAFDDALEGVKPLLMALIANKGWTGSQVKNIAHARVIINVNVALDLNASANQGYANLLVPVYEALGVDYVDVSEVEGTLAKKSDDLAAVFEAILTPIFGFIDKLAANPLDTLISALPNLAYALQMQMAPSLLNMLETNIHYAAVVSIGCDIDAASGDANVKVGDMLKLEDMGLDLSDGLNSLLKGFGLNLPALDQALIAQLGELTAITTQRAKRTYTNTTYTTYDKQGNKVQKTLANNEAFHINADKAAVGYYLLTYIFELLGNEEALSGLLSMFMEEEAIAGLLETLDGIGLTSLNVGDAIAAVVELFNQEEVTEFAAVEGYAGLEGNPLEGAYKDGNNWTKETADYVADNLGTVLAALGLDLNGMIGGLFTNANITALAKDTLSKLDLNTLLADVELPINVQALVKDILGVDLSGFAAYADLADNKTWDFEDGDAAGFVAALVNLLNPLMPIVNFILAGEDINLLGATTLHGYNGYENAIAGLLEALGCEAPELEEGDNVLAVILNAILPKLNAILANPADALQLVVDLLYYLRSDALTVAVKNLLTPVYVLLDTIRPIYDLDLNELLSGLTVEKFGFAIDLNNVSLDFILTLVETLLADKLDELDLHTLNGLIDEVATLKAKNDSYSNGDILTVVLNYLVSQIKGSDDFKVFLKGILDLVIKEDAELTSDDLMIVIANIFDMENVELKDIEWYLTEYADTETVVSPLKDSELYEDFVYGEYYTEEMAEYFGDNFSEFVDNIIFLLGLDLEGDGTYARDLAGVLESLNGIVGGTIYNSEILGMILDAIKGLVAMIDETEKIAALAPQVKELVKLALGVDLTYWDTFTVPADVDTRDEFVTVLCDMLSPLYPILGWLLGDEDISFFVDKDQTDLITLLGAEGYAYGLVPILEALGCKNLVTREEYNTALDNGENDVLITSILNPLLDRVDEILADPAAAILDILPNLIYFINSKGLDASIKNLLNAVYTVLNAIEPLVELDLYAIVEDAIGINIETVTFESLIDFALAKITEATGYELVGIDASAIAELTIGKVESFTSANGNTAYRMVYADGAHKAEVVTVLARLIVTFIAIEGGKNADSLVAILKENLGMDDEAATNFRGFLQSIIDQEVSSAKGMDKALALIYYVFYGADFVIDQTTGAVKDFNALWKDILVTIGRDETNQEAITVGNILADILDITLGGVIDSEGVASNGFIRFFQRIAEFFQRIMDWFRNLFA